MKVAVFWYVGPRRLVEVFQCFRGAYCLHHQGESSIKLPIGTASFGCRCPYFPSVSADYFYNRCHK
jgi:hypothetical protein